MTLDDGSWVLGSVRKELKNGKRVFYIHAAYPDHTFHKPFPSKAEAVEYLVSLWVKHGCPPKGKAGCYPRQKTKPKEQETSNLAFALACLTSRLGAEFA